MANEWYVRHGDKLYGPMTPANLKKLAAGAQDHAGHQRPAWRRGHLGPGLARARIVRSAQAQRRGTPSESRRPLPKAVPVAAPLAAPPTRPPQAPPQAAPLAPPPWARPAAAKAGPAAGVGAKIVGAVAIVLGVVALATFWLPILHGPVGWTAIVAGALGLVVGIAGLIVAAHEWRLGLDLEHRGHQQLGRRAGVGRGAGSDLRALLRHAAASHRPTAHAAADSIASARKKRPANRRRRPSHFGPTPASRSCKTASKPRSFRSGSSRFAWKARTSRS